MNLVSQKMGIHEWSYDNEIAPDARYKVPLKDAQASTLKNIKVEVELGFDAELAFEGGAALPELRRADGVHAQAVHRVRRLRRHLPDGLHHLHRRRRGGGAARAPDAPRRRNPTQDLYVAGGLKTGRIMVKDEDVCLHCGLCAERCPTGAWDMQKFLLDMTHAGHGCRRPATAGTQGGLRRATAGQPGAAADAPGSPSRRHGARPRRAGAASQLAAAYRIADHLGWSELIYTHI